MKKLKALHIQIEWDSDDNTKDAPAAPATTAVGYRLGGLLGEHRAINNLARLGVLDALDVQLRQRLEWRARLELVEELLLASRVHADDVSHEGALVGKLLVAPRQRARPRLVTYRRHEDIQPLKSMAQNYMRKLQTRRPQH